MVINMAKIGVFDSGIGGYSVLEKIKELMPEQECIYYKDSDNLPYGNKSDVELFKIGYDIVSYLVSQGCAIVVIACNTMTTKCIKKLRESFPDIIFVGTEPAIKVACDRNYKNILVMATPATIKSECVSRLIKNNKKDFQNIYLVPCEGLARAIEDDEKDKIKQILENLLEKYKDYNIDCIVLGCTHYTFVKKEISDVIDADFVDGALGVAKQVQRKLKKDFIS